MALLPPPPTFPWYSISNLYPWYIEPPTHGVCPLPMIYKTPYPWYIGSLSMVFWPPAHNILVLCLYPWCIELPIHGILTPLPTEFWLPYPYLSNPLSMVFWPPTHDIPNPLSIVYRTPYTCYFTPYRWYVKPPIHGISDRLSMISWPHFHGTHCILSPLPMLYRNP